MVYGVTVSSKFCVVVPALFVAVIVTGYVPAAWLWESLRWSPHRALPRTGAPTP